MVTVLLALQVVAALAAAAVAGWVALTYADLTGVTADEALVPDVVGGALRLLTLPLTALTGIAFVAWLYRAVRNVREAGTATRHGPGWAIGSWFVPFLNLWRPKQIVDDVWRGSMPTTRAGGDIRRVQKPLLVFSWWGLWLSAQVLASAAGLQTVKATLGAQLDAVRAGADPALAVSSVDVTAARESEALWQLWASGATALAAVLAAVVVLQVSSWQTARMRRDDRGLLALQNSSVVPHVSIAAGR